MANRDSAIARVIHHEGGYVNDPDDPGGATKYGVTQRDWTAFHGDENSNVANISVDDAIQYYAEVWWEKGRWAQLESQELCDLFFDQCVVAGTYAATKALQRACTDLGEMARIDGGFGPQTVEAANVLGLRVIPRFRDEMKLHYAGIVAARPSSAKFFNGWINRLNS